ncbi:MAG: FAD binding domain-containing protein [Clostridiales bacterium]|nr:FAD binding domain-containing protein [Clostridiales bacterium]
MIAYNLDYFKPETTQEAYECMKTLKEDKVNALYYSGGTEVITNLRKGAFKADAVIDLKGIGEMSEILVDDEYIVVGANVPLNVMIEHSELQSLKSILNKIADHTVRNALTIGGNICGKLPFREAVLPLLALNSLVKWVDENGINESLLRDVFDKRLKLPPNAFLYQIMIPRKVGGKMMSKRMEAHTEVDYPVLHVVMSVSDTEVFVGLSGFASFPVYQLIPRNEYDEWSDPVGSIAGLFEKDAKSDERASKEYRVHLLKNQIALFTGGAYDSL